MKNIFGAMCSVNEVILIYDKHESTESIYLSGNIPLKYYVYRLC